MRRAILLLSLAALFACKSAIIHPLMAGNSFEIPVEAAKVEVNTFSTPTATSGVNFDKPDATLEEVIIVPPSDKPTTVEIRRKPHTVKQAFKEALTNTPTHEVRSDNAGVKVEQPHKTVWWRWITAGLLALIFVVALIEAVARRVSNFSPLGMAMKFIRGK